MKRHVFPLLFAVFYSMKTGAANIEEGHAELVCGNATVTASTQFFDDPAYIERQAIRQTLVVHNRQKNVKKKLRLDSKAIHKPTFNRVLLDSLVSAWTCLEAKDGKRYILLWYTCTPMDERGFCADEEKEWDRLFRTDSKALTGSYRRTISGTAFFTENWGWKRR